MEEVCRQEVCGEVTGESTPHHCYVGKILASDFDFQLSHNVSLTKAPWDTLYRHLILLMKSWDSKRLAELPWERLDWLRSQGCGQVYAPLVSTIGFRVSETKAERLYQLVGKWLLEVKSTLFYKDVLLWRLSVWINEKHLTSGVCQKHV